MRRCPDPQRSRVSPERSSKTSAATTSTSVRALASAKALCPWVIAAATRKWSTTDRGSGFGSNNPNRLRSLAAVFGMNNPTQFARADGEGFRFLTGFVADVDGRNPQVAARVLTAFRIWQSFEPKRREAARAAMQALKDAGNLSRNTAEILDRTLAG